MMSFDAATPHDWGKDFPPPVASIPHVDDRSYRYPLLTSSRQ
jgi:hypothetical protein